MMRTWARLKQHWVRHLLAALQVAIGVAVVTAIFVDVLPLIRQITPDHRAAVFSGYYGGQTDDGGMFMSSVFNIDDIKYLENEFDTVAAVSVYENMFSSLVRVDDDLFILRGIAQVSPGFAEIVNLEMTEGRFFLPGDADKEVPDIAVISSALAELIFPGEDPIGKTINLRPHEEEMRMVGYGSFELPSTEGIPGLDFMVVGVFEQPESASGFDGPLSGTSRAEMYVPATGYSLWSLPALSMPIDMPLSNEFVDFEVVPTMPEAMGETYTYVYFRAHDGMGEQAVAEVQAMLGARLNERHGGEVHWNDDMQSTLVIEPAGAMDPWMLQMRRHEMLILGALGVAALVVAGFSVFTTFLASVAERVKAIGLARSLGATRGRVLREVISEAVMLTGFGGLIGALLSYPVRIYLLEPLEGLFASVEAPATSDIAIVIIGALIVAMAIGALAALYPGWTVARMMPAEAFDEE